DRLDPEAMEEIHPRPLASQGGLVELARPRLDAAPLDGEAVGVGADRRKQCEVVAPARAVPGRLAAADVPFLQEAAALPLGPVVLRRPLDLVGRGRDAPEESGVHDRSRKTEIGKRKSEKMRAPRFPIPGSRFPATSVPWRGASPTGPRP